METTTIRHILFLDELLIKEVTGRENILCAINTAEVERVNWGNKFKRSKNWEDSFSLLFFDGILTYRWNIEKAFRDSLVFLA